MTPWCQDHTDVLIPHVYEEWHYYATGTTDVCALQRHLTTLTYHKGLWCSLGMMFYRHLLTSKCWRWPCLSLLLLMLCSFSCSLLMNHVHQSLTVLLISHSLPPSLFCFKALFTRSAMSWQRYLHCPFQTDSISPKQFFAFTELQALWHCVNQPKECFPFKSNSLPHHFAIPDTSSWRAANSKHCPTTPICILNGPI